MKKTDCRICETREYSIRVYMKILPINFEEINFSGSKNLMVIIMK